MYSTCLHCHEALGINDSIERFQVGRRLAFDPATGRLWVVCVQCRRWNLTPLEERWEAIEECERAFEQTRLRASTDNIGLGRLPSGMELIRIGKPLRPEIAAWRYAGDFRRRWLTRGVPLVAVSGVAMLGHTLTGVLGVFAVGGVIPLIGLAAWYTARARTARVVRPDGRVERLSGTRADRIRLKPVGSQWGVSGLSYAGDDLMTGPAAVHTLRAVATSRNFRGAREPEVQRALGLLQEVGDSSRFIARLARASERTKIHDYPTDVSLALEMALHDDIERRALEGELSLLETEWEVAEEIAKVSDDMFVPNSVMERYLGLGGRQQASTGPAPGTDGSLAAHDARHESGAVP